MVRRLQSLAVLWLAALIALEGCSKPQYDTSTPQSTLEGMYRMIADGHPEMLATVLHIEPRDITYEDGVTEASAIEDVIEKSGQMLGRLYRVARKLQDRFPQDVRRELSEDARLTGGEGAAGEQHIAGGGGGGNEDRPRKRASGWANLGRFFADPFGLMDQHRQRVTVQDMGDGTAAILIDSQPAFGIGLQMKYTDGSGWKIDVPIDLLQDYRPNTRQEWAVVANIMLSLERSLQAFEDELDRGDFRNLAHAGNRAGRLLGERVLVQALIYQEMKQKSRT
jgi:hypothetical protein